MLKSILNPAFRIKYQMANNFLAIYFKGRDPEIGCSFCNSLDECDFVNMPARGHVWKMYINKAEFCS